MSDNVTDINEFKEKAPRKDVELDLEPTQFGARVDNYDDGLTRINTRIKRLRNQSEPRVIVAQLNYDPANQAWHASVGFGPSQTELDEEHAKQQAQERLNRAANQLGLQGQ